MARAIINKRGQAFIESLFLGILLVTVITYGLQYALRVQKKFMLDEFIEETLICLVENQPMCIAKLRLRLSAQGYQNITIQNQKIHNTWTLHLKALSVFGEHIEKESELEYDLKVPI